MSKLNDVLAKIETDLSAASAAVAAEIEKARVEITGELAKLRDQIANADIPADAQATLDRLAALSSLSGVAAKAKEIDDVIPDAPAESPIT